MNRIITYCIDQDGIVYSRVASEVAIPVLDYEAIGNGGNGFEKGDFRGPMLYNLEKFPVHSLSHGWAGLKWTKKIPVKLKNKHRKFWGMPPLKGAA